MAHSKAAVQKILDEFTHWMNEYYCVVEQPYIDTNGSVTGTIHWQGEDRRYCVVDLFENNETRTPEYCAHEIVFRLDEAALLVETAPNVNWDTADRLFKLSEPVHEYIQMRKIKPAR